MAQFLSTTNASNIDKTALIKSIIELQEEYSATSGSGLFRKFYSLFDNLPDWLSSWLCDMYFIEKQEIEYVIFGLKKSTWLNMPKDKKIRMIARYLYDQVRSKYTHTVERNNTLERKGFLNSTVDSKEYTFNFYKKDKSNKETAVGIKVGFSESDVLRLLVVYVLRKRIGLHDDQLLIEEFFKNAQDRKLVYYLIHELSENLQIIEWWCAMDLHYQAMQHSYRLYATRLDTKAATQLQENMSARHSRVVYQDMASYLQYIQNVNERIDVFNKHQEEAQATGQYESSELFMKELSKSNDVFRIVYHLRNMQQVLDQFLDYHV